MSKDTESRLKSYTEELENGVFGLAVSMCQQYAMHMPMDQAKEKTAEYLINLANGFRSIKEDNIKEN